MRSTGWLESDVTAWTEERVRKARGVEAEAARPAASGGDSVRAAHTVAADADVDVGIPGAAGDVPVGDESGCTVAGGAGAHAVPVPGAAGSRRVKPSNSPSSRAMRSRNSAMSR